MGKISKNGVSRRERRAVRCGLPSSLVWVVLLSSWLATTTAEAAEKGAMEKKGVAKMLTIRADNTDVGVALNILNRDGDQTEDGDSKSFRFFEGASLYTSLGNGDDVFKACVNLSALDFYENIDFETGVGIGLLVNPGDTRFTISLVRGYNLMKEGDSSGWYTLVGFGWNFNRQ